MKLESVKYFNFYKKNSQKCKLFILLFLFFLYLLPIILHFYDRDGLVFSFLKEDGIYEIVGALVLLFGSFIFFYIFIKSLQKRSKRLFFLFAGIFLFILFGEEISWGQRLFNIYTPEFISNINYQNEINIHNLKFFYKSTINLFDKGINLIIFYFVFVTFLVNIFSVFKKWIDRLNIQTGSLFIALLILISKEMNDITEGIFSIEKGVFDVYRVGEIFETSIELILFIFALECFFVFKNKVGKKLS
ncbi:MAG: hypothetical protein U9O66_01670 [Patescibacteria group bacterium]|nr:hypothetical protein [Patescibacteria group bacterium]